jgi:hypothetical protein
MRFDLVAHPNYTGRYLNNGPKSKGAAGEFFDAKLGEDGWLRGRWKENKPNGATGGFDFEFSTNGDFFSGSYNNAGGGGGTWSGKRKPSPWGVWEQFEPSKGVAIWITAKPGSFNEFTGSWKDGSLEGKLSGTKLEGTWKFTKSSVSDGTFTLNFDAKFLTFRGTYTNTGLNSSGKWWGSKIG